MNGFYYALDIIKNQLELDNDVNMVNTGIIEDVLLKKKDIYPYSHIIVNNATLNGSTWLFSFSVICMDIVDISKEQTTDIFRGQNNLQDVLNTQLVVINRLLEVLRRGADTNLYIMEGNPNCEPFEDRFEHGVAGWTVTFDLLVPNDMTVCATDVTPVKLCPDFEYTITDADSNVLYTGDILSGDSLVQVITSATATNSLGTVLATILAQGTVELADVNNIDTDGSTVPTPAGVAFTCSAGADATLTLNTNSFLTVASGSTTDIELVDQTDTPIVPDSVVGSKITVTFPTGLDAKLTQTGQTVSRMTNDDISRGRDVDFFTLNYVNEFGHSFRFCGVNGGYTDGVDYYDVNGVLSNRATEFVDGVILDFNSRNATEILTYYVNDVFTTRSAIVACTLHSASTFGGLTGWYLWNMREMFNVLNPASFTDLTNWMGYKPFEFAVGQRYIITSTAYAPTSIIRTDLVAANPLGLSAITSALFTVFSRYTTLAELGL